MEVSIIKIGNSKGIRLSREILKRYNFGDRAEILFKGDYLILRPINAVRSDWDQAFKEMNEVGDDELLMDDFFEDENQEEWT